MPSPVSLTASLHESHSAQSSSYHCKMGKESEVAVPSGEREILLENEEENDADKNNVVGAEENEEQQPSETNDQMIETKKIERQQDEVQDEVQDEAKEERAEEEQEQSTTIETKKQDIRKEDDDGQNSHNTSNSDETSIKANNGRRGDPRMHRAVAAKLENPGLSLFNALVEGGFRFPGVTHESQCKGTKRNSIYDADNILLSQRKNQLSRRLRLHARKKAREKHYQMINNNRRLRLKPFFRALGDSALHPQAGDNHGGSSISLHHQEGLALNYDNYSFQANPSLFYQQQALQERKHQQEPFQEIRNSTTNSLCRGTPSFFEQTQMQQRMMHKRNPEDSMYVARMMNSQQFLQKSERILPANSSSALVRSSNFLFGNAPISSLPPQLSPQQLQQLQHQQYPPPQLHQANLPGHSLGSGGLLGALPVAGDNNIFEYSSTNGDKLQMAQHLLYYKQLDKR